METDVPIRAEAEKMRWIWIMRKRERGWCRESKWHTDRGIDSSVREEEDQAHMQDWEKEREKERERERERGTSQPEKGPNTSTSGGPRAWLRRPTVLWGSERCPCLRMNCASVFCFSLSVMSSLPSGAALPQASLSLSTHNVWEWSKYGVWRLCLHVICFLPNPSRQPSWSFSDIYKKKHCL